MGCNFLRAKLFFYNGFCIKNTGDLILWLRKKVIESRLYLLAPNANNVTTTLTKTAKQQLTDWNSTSIVDFVKNTLSTRNRSKEDCYGSATKGKRPNFFKRLGAFFVKSWLELKKVTWPNFKTVLKNTGIVLLVVLFFALIILGADSLFAWLLSLISTKG